MQRFVFLNRDFVRYADAMLPIMDRGFLFGDGVYEVTAVLDGILVDNENHLARLERSLGEIRIGNPYSRRQWRDLQAELVRRNGITEGVVYIQVTRGVAERDFAFPNNAVPTVAMFTQAKRIVDSPLGRDGASVITVPDIRWRRRDVKSVALLAQVLAKQQAVEAGAAEAFMVEDGLVTEGASSNVFIITAAGAVVTRPLSTDILPGVTRRAIMRLAGENGLTVEERSFTVEEAFAASEVFYTSASTFVTPVVFIDGLAIGTGRPGPLVSRLRDLYIFTAREQLTGHSG